MGSQQQSTMGCAVATLVGHVAGCVLLLFCLLFLVPSYVDLLGRSCPFLHPPSGFELARSVSCHALDCLVPLLAGVAALLVIDFRVCLVLFGQNSLKGLVWAATVLVSELLAVMLILVAVASVEGSSSHF